MATNGQFASDGFDLDAIPTLEGNEGGVGKDVVYELGGSATVSPSPNNTSSMVDKSENQRTVDDDNAAATATAQAEEWKQRGNDEFKLGHYLEAYDLYTEAIEACPGDIKGKDILKLRLEFQEEQRIQARKRLEEETRRDRSTKTSSSSSEGDDAKSSSSSKNETKPEPPPEFQLPPQPFGETLAIYYCNRAAALIHMERFDEAITDCDVALLLNPKYTKGYVRRCMAYEKMEDHTEDALRDAKKALELEPRNDTLRKTVSRLQKLEDERLEKLKTETLDKLKELGNSLLGNFGLSLDNFKAVQDPKTGSYNISFNQSNGSN